MMHGREDLFTLVNMLPPMATVLCPQRLEHRTDIGLARGLQISEALKTKCLVSDRNGSKHCRGGVGIMSMQHGSQAFLTLLCTLLKMMTA